ncbi:hypothetical protein [Bradyrhizobium sp. LeoA1S1]
MLNEHQEPLKMVWDWMCARWGQLTPEKIEQRLKAWPMVVITREENAGLDPKEADPVKRYRGLEILYRDDAGTWIRRL